MVPLTGKNGVKLVVGSYEAENPNVRVVVRAVRREVSRITSELKATYGVNEIDTVSIEPVTPESGMILVSYKYLKIA